MRRRTGQIDHAKFGKLFCSGESACKLAKHPWPGAKHGDFLLNEPFSEMGQTVFPNVPRKRTCSAQERGKGVSFCRPDIRKSVIRSELELLVMGDSLEHFSVRVNDAFGLTGGTRGICDVGKGIWRNRQT